jgi:hypothetical protein
MNRNQERASADGYCIQVLIVNGDVQTHLSQKSFYIENIGKGGFRFLSDVNFELEDRVQVLLRFPNGYSQEVLGRICYKEEAGGNRKAYGYSVMEGFYTLQSSAG